MAGLSRRIFDRLGRTYIVERQLRENEQIQLAQEQAEKINALEQNCAELQKKLEIESEALKGAQTALGEVYKYMQQRQEINPEIEENIRNNNRRLDDLDKRSDMQEVKNRSLSLKFDRITAGSGNAPVSGEVSQGENEYDCVDYFDFENHFRGPRETIKEVQRQYIKYFEGRKNVLDLGCGRGEFLELLKENDIEAIGVEFYTEFAEYCRMKDLKVEEADALAYLEGQEKVGGIFAGQLIEHLKFNQIVKLCELAYEKLEDGGYIILETPNPMSLAIYTHAFYMDPSHNKPIHPLTLEYFMHKVGFEHVEILFTESSKYPAQIPELKGEGIENLERFNKTMQEVSQTLFGSQDYAIIGRK
ncbi:MAG: methyltransferase domain-containing protein [Lachnospiraceae bacterium]|nr:methyltransferase domain-containing protein [Lachnospiraceae bacterium]